MDEVSISRWTMPVSKAQAEQLASLAVACRPYGAIRWDVAGVIAAIGKVKELALADVTLAVIRAADDRSVETPGVIGNTRSPCWRERGSDRPTVREPFDRASVCGTCGRGQHADLDHPFVSVVEQTRRLANEDHGRIAEHIAAVKASLNRGATAPPAETGEPA